MGMMSLGLISFVNLFNVNKMDISTQTIPRNTQNYLRESQ